MVGSVDSFNPSVTNPQQRSTDQSRKTDKSQNSSQTSDTNSTDGTNNDNSKALRVAASDNTSSNSQQSSRGRGSLVNITV